MFEARSTYILLTNTNSSAHSTSLDFQHCPLAWYIIRPASANKNRMFSPIIMPSCEKKTLICYRHPIRHTHFPILPVLSFPYSFLSMSTINPGKPHITCTFFSYVLASFYDALMTRLEGWNEWAVFPRILAYLDKRIPCELEMFCLYVLPPIPCQLHKRKNPRMPKDFEP